MKKIPILAFIVLIVASCTGHKNFSTVRPGMSKDQVLAAAGEPSKKNDIEVAELWVYPDYNRTVVFRHDSVYTIITSGEARMDSIKKSMSNIANDVDSGFKDINKGLKKTGAAFDSIARKVKIKLDTAKK